MQNRLLTACLTVTTVALLAIAPRASAGTVNLKFDGPANPGASVSVSIASGPSAGTYNGVPGPYYFSEVNPSPTSVFPNPTTTFCVELTQYIATGSTYTFSVDALTAHLSAAQATAVSELYAGHYNTAWTSSSFTGSSDSTAFQLALWAIVYDTNGNYNLSTGNFKASGSSATTAQSWLNTLSSQPSFSSVFHNEQLVWLSNPSNQDQLALIPNSPSVLPGVPAPPGAVLAGIGFFGLIGRSRWLRRKSATV